MQGSFIAECDRLPINLVANAVCSLCIALAAISSFIKEGAQMHENSVNTRHILLNGDFDSTLIDGKECTTGHFTRKRVLYACGELKLLLFTGYKVSQDTMGEFLGCFLDSTITYVLFLKGY